MRVWGLAWMAIIIVLLPLAACGGDDDEGASATTAANQTYDEGTVRMEIETLDTGLLKGHSYADAAEGWKVESVTATAVDEDGQTWPVIEIPEKQEPESKVLFFEVTIQELPRGQEVTVTTTALFTNDQGVRTERKAVDQWPP